MKKIHYLLTNLKKLYVWLKGKVPLAMLTLRTACEIVRFFCRRHTGSKTQKSTGGNRRQNAKIYLWHTGGVGQPAATLVKQSRSLSVYFGCGKSKRLRLQNTKIQPAAIRQKLLVATGSKSRKTPSAGTTATKKTP